MMKKIVSTVLFSLLVLTSCEDKLDINTDPTTPPEITTGLALSAVEGSLVTVIGGSFFNLGGFYAQYYTQSPGAGQYDEIDTYNINTDFANRSWTELYAGALNDSKYVLENATEEGDTGAYLIATCLQAYTYQMLVDVFGAVPYTNALQGSENLSPAPTPGNEIYTDLIARIDMAIAEYETTPVESSVGEQDLIYGADIDAWIQFANTLKLKMYLRMAYTSQANATAVMDLINEGNFINQDAAFRAFESATNKRHPYYEVQIEYLGDVNNVASSSLYEFLNLNGDPRVDAIFKLNEDGVHVAVDQGAGLTSLYTNQQAVEFSRPKIEPITPVYLMTVSESNFLQAEAIARYGSAGSVAALYNEGVAQSFMLHGLAAADAATFTDAGGNYEFTVGSTEEMVEQIIVQKWAALANVNNIEAWIETTRTKYPTLSTTGAPNYQEGRRIVSVTSVLPGNLIPASIFYPDDEITRNANMNQKTSLTEKVWWDQK